MSRKNIDLRTIVKYLFLKGTTPTQIKGDLKTISENSSLLFNAVIFWIAELKRDRTSESDDNRSGGVKNIAYVCHGIIQD